MSFGNKRHILQPGVWTQISTDADTNVTVDSFGVGAYQNAKIAAGAQAPTGATTAFRTLRSGDQAVFTNLDEGTVLWATATSEAVAVEVLTG